MSFLSDTSTSPQDQFLPTSGRLCCIVETSVMTWVCFYRMSLPQGLTPWHTKPQRKGYWLTSWLTKSQVWGLQSTEPKEMLLSLAVFLDKSAGLLYGQWYVHCNCRKAYYAHQGQWNSTLHTWADGTSETSIHQTIWNHHSCQCILPG